MRDNAWLEAKLNTIWENHFSDIERKNEVFISFGRNARTRLGSIRAKKGSKQAEHQNTQILITGHFKDERVPEFMIDVTIAHELCHYAHGFFSPLPKLSKYPHQGGLVDNELRRRGFATELKDQHIWLKKNWKDIVGLSKRRVVRKRKRRVSLFEYLLGF